MTPVKNLLGAIGETKVTLDLMERGFYTFSPSFEGGAVDLIALKGDKLYKIQVKFRSLREDGHVDITWDGGEGWYSGVVDIIAVYIPELEHVFYVPCSILDGKIAKKRLHIREQDKHSDGYIFNYILFPEEVGSKSVPITHESSEKQSVSMGSLLETSDHESQQAQTHETIAG